MGNVNTECTVQLSPTPPMVEEAESQRLLQELSLVALNQCLLYRFLGEAEIEAEVMAVIFTLSHSSDVSLAWPFLLLIPKLEREPWSVLGDIQKCSFPWLDSSQQFICQ